MTTSTDKYASWADWFCARESSSVIDNSKQESLFNTFGAALSAEECKSAVKKHNDTVFIAKLSLRSGVNMFHHFMETGGTLYDQNKDPGFIQGVSQWISTPTTPDIEVLFEKPTGAAVTVPTPTSILGITSVADIDGLQDGQTTTYKPRNFIPVPPFLIQAINSTIAVSRGDANAILVEVVNAIKEFDTVHAIDAEYTDAAKTKCKPLLYWLYLAGKDNEIIKQIPSMVCSNARLANSFVQLESQCLKRSSYGSKVAFPSLKQPNKKKTKVVKQERNQNLNSKCKPRANEAWDTVFTLLDIFSEQNHQEQEQEQERNQKLSIKCKLRANEAWDTVFKGKSM